MDKKDEAKKKDLVSVFSGYGIPLKKEARTRNWYLTPFGNESNPSCLINKQNNTWRDYSANKGGDVIDFVMEYEGLSFRDAISKLVDGVVPIKTHDASDISHIKTGIHIIDESEITNQSLLLYAESRGISHNVLKQYCREVEFVYEDWDHVSHSAIGFKNDKGGWELRSPSQKVGNSPKYWTTIRRESSKGALIFEGFFDFLSHVMLTNNEDYSVKYLDCYILNGLAFAPWLKEDLDIYPFVGVYLDHGIAANEVMETYFQEDRYHDLRSLYDGFGDYNEFWKHKYFKK